MSRLSPNVRPILSRRNSSSSSLNGMEIPTPKFPPTPKSPYQSYKPSRNGDYHNAKPLPPTPIYPSLKFLSPESSGASSVPSSRASYTVSLSSFYTEDVPPTPKYAPFRRDTLLPPPQPAFEPVTHRSSTSIIPDPPLSRLNLRRQAHTHEILHKPAAGKTGPPESIWSEWRAPKYEEQEDTEDPTISVQNKILAQDSEQVQYSAEQHADDYRSLLAQGSRLPSFNSGAIPELLQSLPGPMSPRITDVVDSSLMPEPLRMSIAFGSDTSSYFSSSSSDVSGAEEENGGSLKSRAKKVFHSRQYSQGNYIRKCMDLHHRSKSPKNKERNKIISMTPSERASIQKGIIDLYDTVTSVYDPWNKYNASKKVGQSAQPKPAIEIPSEGHQSSALPMTPYPQQGPETTEAAESPSPSPRSRPTSNSWQIESPSGKAPRKSHFSISSTTSTCYGGQALSSAEKKKMKRYNFSPNDQSAVKGRSAKGKWKKAVTFDKRKGSKTEGEKRRESMKKKIVIVGAVDQGPFKI